MKVEEVVPNAVGKDPECTASAGQEALPPPVVVLLQSASRFCETNGFNIPRSKVDCRLR